MLRRDLEYEKTHFCKGALWVFIPHYQCQFHKLKCMHHCLVVTIIVCQQNPFDKSVRLILMMLRDSVCVTFFCSKANRLVTIIYVVGHSHELCDAHCLIYIGTFLGTAFF